MVTSSKRRKVELITFSKRSFNNVISSTIYAEVTLV
jgi:hypothetical protein